MAKLVFWLSLTVVLSAVCARGTRQEITHGRSVNAVDADRGRGGRSFGRFGQGLRFSGPGRWREGLDSSTSLRRRGGRWREERGPRDDMHGMRRMSRPMPSFRKDLGREGGRRMVERLREELSRFRNHGAGRRRQDRDQFHRRFHPDAGADLETGRGHHGMGAGNFFDPRLDLMEHGRGPSRRPSGNDLWGQGRLGLAGGHHPIRMGIGHRRGGHHQRGPHRSGFGRQPIVF